MNIDVIIPALNEEAAIAKVVSEIPSAIVRDIIVVDNGSVDNTSVAAQNAGARVILEPMRGYGQACLSGISALKDDCDIVVFLDGDGSDFPAQLQDVVAPIIANKADFVVGSRALGSRDAGSITVQQRVGNKIASLWLAHRFGLKATDLGPFRAIKRSVLEQLQMLDRNYGWTIEMQIKAAVQGVRYAEVPVDYRPRIGISKVSGTVRGVVGASTKILALLAYYDLCRILPDKPPKTRDQ